MNPAELGEVIGTALAPIVLALAPWLHTRLRQLEQVRNPNAQRVGNLEDNVNHVAGRLEELSRFVHGMGPPSPAEPTGDEPDTASIRVVTCPGCGTRVPVRRTQ